MPDEIEIFLYYTPAHFEALKVEISKITEILNTREKIELKRSKGDFLSDSEFMASCNSSQDIQKILGGLRGFYN